MAAAFSLLAQVATLGMLDIRAVSG